MKRLNLGKRDSITSFWRVSNMPKPQAPFKIFAPGVVIDANGAALINPVDVLLCLGVEDTPENRNLVVNSIKAELARQLPNSGWTKERG